MNPQVNDPLSLTVHDGPPPQLPDRRRGRLTMLLVLLACAAPVIISYFFYFVVRPEGRNNYADLILPTRTMPAELPLTDAVSQEKLAPHQLKGQWLLIVVAGGQCDAKCESLLYEQRQLREMLGRDRDRLDRVWLVVDDVPVRAPMLQAMQSGVPGRVLRVPRQSLEAWLTPAAGQVLEDSFFLVDPMGEWMMRTPPHPDPMRFKKDLERLMRASAFWDRAGREAS